MQHLSISSKRWKGEFPTIRVHFDFDNISYMERTENDEWVQRPLDGKLSVTTDKRGWLYLFDEIVNYLLTDKPEELHCLLSPGVRLTDDSYALEFAYDCSYDVDVPGTTDETKGG